MHSEISSALMELRRRLSALALATAAATALATATVTATATALATATATALISAAVALSAKANASANAAPDDSLKLTQAACNAFKAKIAALPGYTSGTIQVPADWTNTKGATVPVFWWKRAGTRPSATPIAFLHGGVAGSSWALLDKWQEVLNNYPGDVVSFDHRGEGCSKTLPSNLHPSQYAHLNVRPVVRDLEYLRQHVFGYKKWRVVGHSRGSALIHYYLEMAPEGLESAHAMGFSLSHPDIQAFNTLTRAQGFYDTAKAYLLRYPGDEERVKQIKSWIQTDTCWNALDDRKVCGPSVVDVFANLLSRQTSWGDLHNKIQSMVDFNSAYAVIQARLPLDVYGHFNYIMGTNALTFGSPDLLWIAMLKENPVYKDPFLSEIRYIGDAIMPTVGELWRAQVDAIDYATIKTYLREHPEFKYFLYSGALDPIAPPQAFKWETSELGSLVNFVTLPSSAHDGWFDPILIANILK